MNETHSDAFVFFGATGDLAFKKIFPSLQAMAGRGHLNVPVIGIGRSAPDLAALKERARPKLFPGRVAAAARWGEPSEAEIAAKPWLPRSRRLIFISDMGDALSKNIAFEDLKTE